MRTALLLLCYLWTLQEGDSHGRLIEPPSRASAWRYGFDTPHNYNDHESYCGGFTRQWVKNGGKCGVCGDPWDAKRPRAHEYGGTFYKGVIVRKYGVGATIVIRVELTANHNGYFEFSICPDYENTNQECLDANKLKLDRPQDGVDHEGYRYFPKEGNKVYEMRYKLPRKTCMHCVLQWRYIAGNNWGNCPNGTGAVGCGPQEEFRACADITIQGKAIDEPMLPPLPSEDDDEDYNELEPPKPISSTYSPPVEEEYEPFSALVISLVSFLVVFMVLFLLYFHYYQVGRQVKNWIKGTPSKQFVPTAPPRTKRNGKLDGINVNTIEIGRDCIL